MPKSKVSKTRMFREAAVMKKKYLSHNGLKYLYPTLREWEAKYNIKQQHITAMLFIYDLEFFTIDYLCDKLGRNKHSFFRDIISPLRNNGYIYKHFDKLTPSDTAEDHLFRDETKYNYRVRYALTQKGRLLVARFYRTVAGEATGDPNGS